MSGGGSRGSGGGQGWWREDLSRVVRSSPVALARACLLLSGEARPSFEQQDVDDGLALLEALAADARPDVPVGGTAREHAEGLRRALGERCGFAGSDRDYDDLDASLLEAVLVSRRGLPILLAVVWVEVARRLGVPAVGVGLPGHFVVAVGGGTGVLPDGAPEPGVDVVHVDPFAGGRVRDVEWLDRRVRAAVGRPLDAPDLRPWDGSSVLMRVLGNVRGLGTRMPDPLAGASTSLWATELSLLLPRHPLVLRRERGLLLGRLGRLDEGARELEGFAEVVAEVEPEVAADAVREARALRSRLS